MQFCAKKAMTKWFAAWLLGKLHVVATNVKSSRWIFTGTYSCQDLWISLKILAKKKKERKILEYLDEKIKDPWSSLKIPWHFCKYLHKDLQRFSWFLPGIANNKHWGKRRIDRTNALMLIGLLNDLGLWCGKLSCLNQRINLSCYI